jgi:hypothetical protein
MPSPLLDVESKFAASDVTVVGEHLPSQQVITGAKPCSVSAQRGGSGRRLDLKRTRRVVGQHQRQPRPYLIDAGIESQFDIDIRSSDETVRGRLALKQDRMTETHRGEKKRNAEGSNDTTSHDARMQEESKRFFIYLMPRKQAGDISHEQSAASG